MTTLLFNALGPGAGAGQRGPGGAPGIFDADESGSALRFGEAMRAQASDGSAQSAGSRVGGGLLATRAAAPDLQIDDADILRQLGETNANAAMIARTRVTVGAKDAQADDSDVLADEREPAVSLVSLTTDAAEIPSMPLTIASLNTAGATNVAAAVDPTREARTASPAAQMPVALEGPLANNAATLLIGVDTRSNVPLASASITVPPSAARLADGALFAMNAVTSGEQQGSNLLVSQSHPLLMAMASVAPDARAAGTDEVVGAPPSDPSRQGLIDALGERLNVQLNRGSSQATIRLDPPMMGTIEIVIRHGAAGVQVHLSATHGDVLRQLHSIGNALSQDLTERNHGQVTVHVSESSRDADGRRRDRHGASADSDATPGNALRTSDEHERPVTFTLV